MDRVDESTFVSVIVVLSYSLNVDVCVWNWGIFLKSRYVYFIVWAQSIVEKVFVFLSGGL